MFELAQLIADLVGEPFARSYGAFRFTVMNRPDAGAIQAQVVRLVSCLLAVISLGLIFFTIEDRKSTRLNSSH